MPYFETGDYSHPWHFHSGRLIPLESAPPASFWKSYAAIFKHAHYFNHIRLFLRDSDWYCCTWQSDFSTHFSKSQLRLHCWTIGNNRCLVDHSPTWIQDGILFRPVRTHGDSFAYTGNNTPLINICCVDFRRSTCKLSALSDTTLTSPSRRDPTDSLHALLGALLNHWLKLASLFVLWDRSVFLSQTQNDHVAFFPGCLGLLL